MNILIYETYSEIKLKQHKEVCILKDSRYLGIIVEELPKPKKERIEKILEIQKEFNLKFIEITQNQFLNYIKNTRFEIREIKFHKEIEMEEMEEITELLDLKKMEEIVDKISMDDYYYYIESIKIKLLKERIKITINKNLELELEDDSMEKYSKNDFFSIVEKNNIIEEIVNQGDEI